MCLHLCVRPHTGGTTPLHARSHGSHGPTTHGSTRPWVPHVCSQPAYEDRELNTLRSATHNILRVPEVSVVLL